MKDSNDDKGIFKYPNELEREFDVADTVPREFSNLKKNIERHLSDSISYRNSKLLEEQKKAEKSALTSKNEKTGVNVGRLCTRLYLKGRPYIDFEDEIVLHKTNGSIRGAQSFQKISCSI